jgi:hypothetical protein
MLLATILLMCPLPQSGDVLKTQLERPAAVAEDSTSSSSNSTSSSSNDDAAATALPAVPEAKIKTDAELASDANAGAAGSSAPLAVATPGTPAAVVTPAKPVLRGDAPTDHEKKQWYALIAISSGAAAFDAWSTRRAISGGYGTEANPMLRPFAHSNAMYAATQVSPLVLDLIGRKMMTSSHKLLRRFWWAPQMAGTDVSVSAGIHNVSVVP